jgi:hypothetical protein
MTAVGHPETLRVGSRSEGAGLFISHIDKFQLSLALANGITGVGWVIFLGRYNSTVITQHPYPNVKENACTAESKNSISKFDLRCDPFAG